MASLIFLIPLSFILVAIAAAAFFWAVDAGQFDDLDASAQEALSDRPAEQAGPRANPRNGLNTDAAAKEYP